jgi:hypothetical protein
MLYHRAERLTDRLVTQADAKDRCLSCQLPNEFD